MSDRRRGLAVLLSLAVIASLSACVSIPSSGSVDQGVSINEDSSGGNVQYNPEGPVAGAKQQDILKGFVAAFTSATNGYAVAKQYLSSDFQSKWDPRTAVQVRNGPARIAQVDDTSMEYSFTASATVDPFGAYKGGSQPFTLDFSFVKERGQWRISSAPSGIVLSDQTFQRIFVPSPIYFFDADNQHLVPDLRWFPNGTAATRVAAALLQGPPAWLTGSVFSRFPDGTQLSDGSSVVVDSGVARVDLSKEASAATAKDRQLMQVQLSESLRSVPSISRVSLSVEGTPLQIDDLGASGPQADTKVDPQALVFRQNEFGFYANGKVASLSGLSTKVVALNPDAATLSSDQTVAAVLARGGVSIVRKGTTAATATAPPIDTRPGLIPPSLDESGYVWSVPTSSPNAINVYDETGQLHQLTSPGLPADAQIVSLEISRDGARVAILLSTSTGPRLVVAAILRDEKQVPLSLGTPILDVSFDGDVAVDASWADQLTVATLVISEGQSNVQLFTVGGQRVSLDPFVPAAAIVGGNSGQDGLRALGADHTIWTYRGSWQSSKITADFIATQR
ncbi:LpqB family beta-propeller domain-containing protein [Glaciihabitans sp. UYNi722]|uniref:LpqB family beta-propeller domain-containing protein n=1 Tax=Glaciihabitans sp. UYNi722 TaxID=3156344 RepID=UPI003398E57B